MKWSVSVSVVSDSLLPQGLYSPCNSLGQNTGVGSLSLLQGIFPTQELNPGLPHCRQILYHLSHQGNPFPALSKWVKVTQSCPTLQPRELYSPWNSPDQNTGVGSLSLLQGIFPTQELNAGFLHCRQILNQLSHKGSPRILEWVACPFFSISSFIVI